ncbi:MAG: hypothetical protein Q4G44_02610 [Alcaligenaceae bacterium]|nr:hypothetical protein [Alcaligenaceae bacterium]
MKVMVNQIELTIFTGATVADALRAYFTSQNQRAPCPLPEVRDRYGNEVAHDGALTEGCQLIIQESDDNEDD